METSARRLLIKKQTGKPGLGLLNYVFQCSKCRKYNTIIYSDDTITKPKTQTCIFCSNPNYIHNK